MAQSSMIIKITNPAANTQVCITFEETPGAPSLRAGVEPSCQRVEPEECDVAVEEQVCVPTVPIAPTGPTPPPPFVAH
jgi:hypothetical protein